MTGEIPPEIGELTNLKTLGLSGNRLSGDLPSQLRNLSNLEHLSLSNNLISGIAPLSELSSLKVIDLDGNRITDLAPLAANPALDGVIRINIRKNPLNEASIDTHIPKLKGHGINVLYDENVVYGGPQIFNENVVVLPVEELTNPEHFSPRGSAGRFYDYFANEFDFLIFLANFVAGHFETSFAASFGQVKNDISGIGRVVSPDQHWPGADRLQGLIFFPSAEPQFPDDMRSPLASGNTLVHELAHRWANFVIPTSPHGDPNISAHWGFSSANGVLGGFDIADLTDHGGGRYSAGHLNPAGSGYSTILSPIELYLAGFIPSSEVPDIWVALDGKWLEDDTGGPVRDANGYRMFTATQVRTYTIEDIIEEHGPRIPSVSQAQKAFRAAVILLVDEYRPANLRLLNLLSEDASSFTYRGNPSDKHINFYEGTGGRSTITLGGLSQTRKDNFPVEPPYRPSGLTVTTTNQNELTVTWDAPPIDGGSAITAYDLRYIEASADKNLNSNWTSVEDAWTGTGGLEFRLLGLRAGTRYDIQVKAFNSAGEGPWSKIGNGTTEQESTPTPEPTPEPTPTPSPTPTPEPTPTAPCVQGFIGSTVNGSWEAVCSSSARDGRYARYYTFTLEEVSDVTITLTSDEDTYLYIREGEGQNGTILHENDDIRQYLDLDSRVEATLGAGVYTVEATTYDAGVTGEFTLTVTGLPVTDTPTPNPTPTPTPEPTPNNCVTALEEDDVRDGSWDSDCASENRNGRYARYYTFTIEGEAEVSIMLESDTDAYLFLLSGEGRDGNVLYENDDIQPPFNLNSQIVETLSAGTYTIEATTYDWETGGEFTLTVSGLPAAGTPTPTPTPEPTPTPVPPPTDPCIEALADSDISGNWTGDCESTEREGSYARYYTFTLVEEADVTVTLTSEVDTFLYIREGAGRDGIILHENDDIEPSVNLKSQITQTLSAGTYTIEATTYNARAIGEFTLTVSGLPAGSVQTPEPSQDRADLVALYNSTNGANWTINENWLSEKPLGDWHGVRTDDEGRVIQLRLRDNNLAGPVPEILGELSNLRLLALQDNRLSGALPTELAGLPNLEYLSLRNNQVSGQIPSAFTNLSSLNVLHLDGNSLSGEIPAELGNLSNLRILILARNQLSGEIPSELGSLSNLEEFLAWGNNLSGEIPAELAELSSLEVLSLWGNNLSGEIPAELAEMSSLEVLSLSRNQLRGDIPSEFGRLANLTDLYLNGNHLTGEIPAALGNLRDLKVLSLPHNQLSGGMPLELFELSGLSELYLFENHLNGELPFRIG